jgi:hypothetical protein
MEINKLNLEVLTHNELLAINGGGELVKDLGELWHKIEDKACQAKEWIQGVWNDLFG